MVSSISASAVKVKVKQSGQEKGKLSQGFLTQALQGGIGAFASGSIENKGLLISQALPLSQASLGRQQAFVISCASCCHQAIVLLPKLETTTDSR